MTGPCACGATDAKRFPVLHHMPCAYVGPSYDFTALLEGYRCPKCDASFTRAGHDSEILGHAWRCQSCGAEWLEEDGA